MQHPHFFRARRLIVAAMVTTAVIAPLTSFAQTAWPAKPVTIVVPFPAGGGTDAFARPLTATLSKNTGKQFIIDNRGGAGGTLGASIAAKASVTARYNSGLSDSRKTHHETQPSLVPQTHFG